MGGLLYQLLMSEAAVILFIYFLCNMSGLLCLLLMAEVAVILFIYFLCNMNGLLCQLFMAKVTVILATSAMSWNTVSLLAKRGYSYLGCHNLLQY